MRRRANTGPRGTRPLLGLAPGGVLPAGVSPHRWCALTAPFHPCLPYGGRYVSVPLSVRSPCLGVTQRPALWSSDFPRPPASSGRPRTLGPLQPHSTTLPQSMGHRAARPARWPVSTVLHNRRHCRVDESRHGHYHVLLPRRMAADGAEAKRTQYRASSPRLLRAQQGYWITLVPSGRSTRKSSSVMSALNSDETSSVVTVPRSSSSPPTFLM